MTTVARIVALFKGAADDVSLQPQYQPLNSKSISMKTSKTMRKPLPANQMPNA